MNKYWTKSDNDYLMYFVGPYSVVVWGYLLFLPEKYQSQTINELLEGLNNLQFILLLVGPYWGFPINYIIRKIKNE